MNANGGIASVDPGPTNNTGNSNPNGKNSADGTTSGTPTTGPTSPSRSLAQMYAQTANLQAVMASPGPASS